MNIKSERITLVEKPSHTLQLEFTTSPDHPYAILHLVRVTGFNKQVLRELDQTFKEVEAFLGLHYSCLYTGMDPARKDLAKLATRYGFVEADAPQETDTGLWQVWVKFI